MLCLAKCRVAPDTPELAPKIIPCDQIPPLLCHRIFKLPDWLQRVWVVDAVEEAGGQLDPAELGLSL